jgi:hypothetical protein
MKILLIAYFFPPDVTSGAFRPMHFARYLEELGEEVFVLTAREEDFMPYQDKDPRLLHYLNENIHIVRSRAYNFANSVVRFRDWLFRSQPQPDLQGDGSFTTVAELAEEGVPAKTSFFQEIKDIITDSLSIPDHHIGWLPPAVNLGRKVIKEHDIDVLFATGNPWTSMLIGVLLKKFTKKPVVLDFRDPWTQNYVFLEKRKFIRSIEKRLERWVVASADHIVANTEELKQDFLRRHAFLSAERMTAIPNGFEGYQAARPVHNDKLTITHAGTLKDRNPRFLIEAALDLVEKQVIPKEELRLVFLGGILVKDPQLIEILKHPVVQEIVDILPRLSYQDAMDFQYNSDVLLIIQPEYFALQIPRKLYEYMAFRKIIFAITNRDGATAALINTYGLGVVAPDEIVAIETGLNTLYQRWKNGELERRQASDEQKSIDRFTNKHLTGELRNIFRQCCQKI